MLNLFRVTYLAMVFYPVGQALAADCGNWPEWDTFRANFLSAEGRVIDPSTPAGQTTSEGQSYALFFALVANDRESFGRILEWTEANLAGGDLTAHLPAWQWGKKVDGSWGVLDGNSAMDSDLWIAYALIEAGRLWQSKKYNAQGELLAEHILREESIELPQLGLALLPGQTGFRLQDGVVRLNPSYFPLQLLRRLSALHPDSEWQRVASSAIEIIVRSAPYGFAPDWVAYSNDSGFLPDTGTVAVGSHNAIRVYLWAGTLAEDEPMRQVLLERFAPMVHLIERDGAPPLTTDTRHGTASGTGSAGFSAALLPLLAASKKNELLRQQRLRIDALDTLGRKDNYYDQALTLFGLGWMDNHYRFDRNGTLRVHWSCD